MIIAPGTIPQTQTPAIPKTMADYQKIIDFYNNKNNQPEIPVWKRQASIDAAQSAQGLIRRGNSAAYVDKIFDTEIVPTKQKIYRQNFDASFTSEKPQTDVATEMRKAALGNLEKQQLSSLSSTVKKPKLASLALPSMKATVLK